MDVLRKILILILIILPLSTGLLWVIYIMSGSIINGADNRGLECNSKFTIFLKKTLQVIMTIFIFGLLVFILKFLSSQDSYIYETIDRIFETIAHKYIYGVLIVIFIYVLFILFYFVDNIICGKNNCNFPNASRFKIFMIKCVEVIISLAIIALILLIIKLLPFSSSVDYNYFDSQRPDNF